MYFACVPATFALCSGLFLLSFYATGATVEKSCARVSAFHHFVAMCLGFWSHYQYSSRVADDASFGPNHEFPDAVVLQHFNLGYFFYDLVHVVVWDHRFIIHHLVAIAGYGTSEIANVFALANAVNTWVTELGSLMYSAYLIVRSDAAYLLFVLLYSASRAFFAWWSVAVLRQVRRSLAGPVDGWSYPPWAPYCAATLQVSLLVINVHFLYTHWRKAWKKLRGKDRHRD